MLRSDDRAAARLTGPSGRPSGASPDAVRRALAAADAAAEKMATDVVVLDVAPIISIAEVFLLVNGANVRQVRTLVDEVERALRELDGAKPISTEGLDDASWVLLDYGDVVVHVFLPETRAYYDLDRLWADAARVPWSEPRGALA